MVQIMRSSDPRQWRNQWPWLTQASSTKLLRVFVVIHIKHRRESKNSIIRWRMRLRRPGNGQAMVSAVDVHALRLQSVLYLFHC